MFSECKELNMLPKDFKYQPGPALVAEIEGE